MIVGSIKSAQILSLVICLLFLCSCTAFVNKHSTRFTAPHDHIRRAAEEVTSYPTSQPTTITTFVYVQPTNPADQRKVVKTPSPTGAAISIISEPITVKPGGEDEPIAKIDEKPKDRVNKPDNESNDIGGAQNINKEIEEEDDTAQKTAKYFFLTFLVCIALFAAIFTFKRSCGSGTSEDPKQPPKYSVLSTTDPAEDDEAGFFSNRNLELARRPPSS